METQDFDSETREMLGLDDIEAILGEIGGDLTIDSDGADGSRENEELQVEALDESEAETDVDTESN